LHDGDDSIGATITEDSGDSDASNAPPHQREGEPKLLMYFLGIYEQQQCPPNAWDFLTVQDMFHLTVVSKTIKNQLSLVEYTKCRDGKDYLVPFPAFPGLLSTKSDNEVGAGLFPHQLATLQAMTKAENSTNEFGCLRGGILGDAPGLGKTISMLAMIVSTSGRRPVNPPQFWDETSLQEDWDLTRKNPAKQEDLLRAMKPLRECIYANSPIHADDFSRVASYVSPPYNDDRLPTISSFYSYVSQELGDFASGAAMEGFRRNIFQLKSQMDKRSRKLFASRNSHHVRRLLWERQLLPSCATLVVVPDALLEHWYLQICSHVNFDVFRDSKDPVSDDNTNSNTTGDGNANSNAKNAKKKAPPRGLVYFDHMGDLADLSTDSFEAPSSNRTSSTRQKAQLWQLSQYMIVVTTFDSCRDYYGVELRLGRLDHVETESQNPSSRTSQRVSRKRTHSQRDTTSIPVNPFLSMRWLRLVVDEGHELGTHEASSPATRFINMIAAERRWVMSGTPTTGDEDDSTFSASALDQIQRLLQFLRHPKYGALQEPSATAGTATSLLQKYNTSARQRRPQSSKHERVKKAQSLWDLEIKQPFLNRSVEGRDSLLSLLKSLFVMHRKDDIKLPKPVFVQAEVDVPIPLAVQDRIVTHGRSGLHSLVMQHFDLFLHSEEFQSMVDAAQAKYIVKVVDEARRQLDLRGGPDRTRSNKVEMFDSMSTRVDRRPIKAIVYSHDRNNLLSVTEQLYRCMPQESIAEIYATSGSDIGNELHRFRYDSIKCQRCSVCQRLTELASGGIARRNACQQMLIEVVLEEDPSVRFLIEPERIVTPINIPVARMGGELLESYCVNQRFWRPDDLVLVDIREDHPLLPRRKPDEYWDKFGLEKCHEIAEEEHHMGASWYFGRLPVVENARERVRARIAKWQGCGKFHNRSWFTGTFFGDSPIETIKQDVRVLSLDAELSHGLDLSFATHMFLLEPIEDAALLEQVTSRANRLGATGPVQIETVNTFYKLSDDTQRVLDNALSRPRFIFGGPKKKNEHDSGGKNTKKTASIQQDKARQLNKVVCQYCYRQFDSYCKAEAHETTKCPRNPSIEVNDDKFQLSSIYREIRPPRVPSNCHEVNETTTNGGNAE